MRLGKMKPVLYDTNKKLEISNFCIRCYDICLESKTSIKYLEIDNEQPLLLFAKLQLYRNYCKDYNYTGITVKKY